MLAMKNTTAASYHKDNDSIATMECELECIAGKSTNLKSLTGSINLSHTGSKKTPVPIVITNRLDDDILAEESLATIVIKTESLAQRQCQTPSRLDNMDAILLQILGTLKSVQVSSYTNSSLSETGSTEGSGNNT